MERGVFGVARGVQNGDPRPALEDFRGQFVDFRQYDFADFG